MIRRETLDITSQLDELPRVRAFLRRFCQPLVTAGYPEEALSELELAVNEAVANVMKHAYQGRTDYPIRMDLQAEDARIVVSIRHQGAPFTPEAVPPPSFDGSRSNGFGVYLIRQCVDEVEYLQEDAGGNCIRLIKSFTL